MNLKEFENNRWTNLDQKEVFRHRVAFSYIDDCTKENSVLDYGCGDGYFLELLKKHNIRGVGGDISEKGVSKCVEKGLEAYVMKGTNDEVFSNKSFDYVVALDVLEHVYNPVDILQDMCRLSGKYLIIGVPNFNSLPARIQVLLGKVPENNRPNKGHIYWFNYDVLKKVLKDNDLGIIDLQVNTFWENKPVIGKFMRFLVKVCPSIFALSFVLKIKK